MKNYDIYNPLTTIEPEVGEEFTINNIQTTYQCICDPDINSNVSGCDLCGLIGYCSTHGNRIHCEGSHRQDGNDVYFI